MLNNIDVDAIIEMIEEGHIGELVDISSADGDIVKNRHRIKK